MPPPDAPPLPTGWRVWVLGARSRTLPAAMVPVLVGTAAAVQDGAHGPNQVKAYTRCGMGPCQGRYCALTVTEIVAAAQQRPPADVGCLRARFPVKPVALGDLAAMPVSAEALAAVYREGGKSTH